VQSYATENVSFGSTERPYDSDMTHSYRLTEGRLIRYPVSHVESMDIQRAFSVDSLSFVLIRRVSRGWWIAIQRLHCDVCVILGSP